MIPAGEPAPPKPRRRVPARLLAGVLVLLCASLVWFALARPSETEPGAAGDRGQTEQTRGRASSKGARGSEGADDERTASSDAPGAPELDLADALASMTGAGATLAQWEAAHEKVEIDGIPGAYGPMVTPEAPTYVVSCCTDRISNYLVVAPAGSTLTDLQAIAAAQMPADAIAGAVEDRPGCPAQRFTSPTIEAAYSDGQVVAAVYYLPSNPDAPDGLPYVTLAVVGADAELVC